jgi:hypothetical protein
MSLVILTCSPGDPAMFPAAACPVWAVACKRIFMISASNPAFDPELIVVLVDAGVSEPGVWGVT